MAVLLTGKSPADGKIPHLDPGSAAVPPEADKPAPTDARPGQPPLQDSAPEGEVAMAELLRLLSEGQSGVIPALSGYLITEDPTYLPEEGDARALARRLGRDRMLVLLISEYLRTHAVSGEDE